MKSDRKERLIKQLEHRLDRLLCLTRATRHRVLEHARGRLTASKIAAYIQERVAFLERWIAPVDHPAFLEVCRELGPIRTRNELQRRLGVRSSTAPGWLDVAVKFHRDKPRWMFFASNAWVLQFQEATANERAVGLLKVADALDVMGRSDAAASLLEGHLGVTAADYDDPTGLANHLREAKAGLMPDNAAGLVGTLANALVSVGRLDAAVSLLEGYLGLTGAIYDDREGLAGRLRASTVALTPDDADLLVLSLADALRLRGNFDNSLALLENRIAGKSPGLTEHSYDDPAGMVNHLRVMSAGLPPDSPARLILALHFTFGGVGRTCPTVSELKHRLNRIDASFADPAALGNRLRDQTTGVITKYWAGQVSTWADILSSVGRFEAAASLLNGFLGLTDAVGDDLTGMGKHLKKVTTGLEPDDVALLVWRLAEALREAGRAEEGVRLLNIYMITFQPLDDAPKPSPGAVVLILDRWFYWSGVYDPQRAQQTAHKVFPYLRHALRRPGMSLDDRKRRVQLVRDLRLTLGKLAYFWAECADDPGEVRQWLLTAQVWDAELGQRVLLERFLLGRVLYAGDDGAREPATRWPFTGREPADCEPPGASQTLAAFGAEVGGDAAPTGIQTPLAAVGIHPPWLAEAERCVNRGLDEPALARALGPDTLLLRLSVSTSTFDERLQWAATRSDGERLEVVAHGAGQFGDRSRLAWAVARHDLRIALAYLSPDVTRKLLVRLGRAYGGGALLMPDRDEGLLRDDTGDLVSQLGRDHEGFGNRFEAVCTPLMKPGPDLADQWRATLEALVRTAGRPVRDLAPLNAATAEYLAEVGFVCDLGTLAEHLEPGLDVVVQADDVLHAVPVAHLGVSGKPLWEQVRSVRASLSVLLDVVQRRIEQEHEGEVPSSRRLMTVSWVRPGDPVRHATQRLHREQQELASPSRFDLEWRGAAEDPTATPGTLFRGIDGGPLRALTVCGHGDERRAGVRLAGAGEGERLWSGQGRDLGGVEWLLLVSCSVGRVQGSSERDVEGLCVELALHRCRSVLAAKWPVEGLQATAVAGRVLEEYLGLRRQFDAGQLGPDLSDARLRSLALNRARQWLGPDYLNTLAAFELYGLG
jgi:hypothetical protein